MPTRVHTLSASMLDPAQPTLIHASLALHHQALLAPSIHLSSSSHILGWHHHVGVGLLLLLLLGAGDVSQQLLGLHDLDAKAWCPHTRHRHSTAHVMHSTASTARHGTRWAQHSQHGMTLGNTTNWTTCAIWHSALLTGPPVQPVTLLQQ